jgi:hypothetical protein
LLKSVTRICSHPGFVSATTAAWIGFPDSSRWRPDLPVARSTSPAARRELLRDFELNRTPVLRWMIVATEGSWQLKMAGSPSDVRRGRPQSPTATSAVAIKNVPALSFKVSSAFLKAAQR